MGRNLKIQISIFALIALYGAYYWGIPAVINLPQRVDFIEKTVFEKSGYKIKIEKPTLKMGLLPSVWVGASNFAVLNDDNSKALDVENPNINVKLFSNKIYHKVV